MDLGSQPTSRFSRIQDRPLEGLLKGHRCRQCPAGYFSRQLRIMMQICFMVFVILLRRFVSSKSRPNPDFVLQWIVDPIAPCPKFILPQYSASIYDIAMAVQRIFFLVTLS